MRRYISIIFRPNVSSAEADECLKKDGLEIDWICKGEESGEDHGIGVVTVEAESERAFNELIGNIQKADIVDKAHEPPYRKRI